ncbi:DUF1878 family protein [Ornithinibacillus sp. BX22]|uniref:DUF1878 family protein n=1 Tax=Ornithinibacillus hominis TaxID=2763055 RepID=A0A923L527_9BACI|nr:DUF1878 family protein [Ornithinibacillus hominis]MBC5636624.1 DUF1878 family protein [Ornithinibacillus hominis]
MSEHNNLATFHLQLLTRIIDVNKFPFTKLVIENEITEEEYKEIFHTIENINSEYIEQKEEGLLHYSSLLARFAGLLNPKLNPTDTIYALRREGYFPDLLDEFIQILKKDGL